ncbi:MAG: methyltransferase domain-containing protein [Chloroflexi bacterium]|nr:methyltransferase domain-containing protein [Chloroflexota bacterium]
MEDTKKLVQRQFTQNAEAYATSVLHGRGASLGRIVELAQPQAGDLALDVATAVGHTAMALAPHTRKVIGLDLTAATLVPAKRLSRERGLSNIEWMVGDVESLPLATAAFDVVVCRIALHHWPNAPQGIREMARVTRRGGRVVLVDNVVPNDRRLADFVNHYERTRDPSHHLCYALDELLAMFAGAGLRQPATETLDKPTPFEDWVKRSSTPPAVVEELRAMLKTPEAAATIRPQVIGGILNFHLTETVIAAVKE